MFKKYTILKSFPLLLKLCHIGYIHKDNINFYGLTTYERKYGYRPFMPDDYGAAL